MARVPQSLSVGQTTATSLTSLYTVLTGDVLAPSLILNNVASAPNELSVFINDGAVDFLIAKRTIPAGKSWRVIELATQKLNPTFAVKIQAGSTTAINHFLSGTLTNDT